MRNLLASIIVAVLLPLSFAGTAEAVPGPDDRNTDPCVSGREVFRTPSDNRVEIEKRWEVEGQGQRSVTPLGASWLYPSCKPGFIAVASFRNGTLYAAGLMSDDPVFPDYNK